MSVFSGEVLTKKIEEMIAQILQGSDIELVELIIHRTHGQTTIRVLADKTHGGINLEECTTLNRRISAALEDGNWIDEAYMVEVSSPGVDRPLKTLKDFLRVIGRPMRLFLSQPVAERIEYDGILLSADNDALTIAKDDRQTVIPFASIHKGKEIIE